MNHATPEGTDRRTHDHNEPRDDTPPDALRVWYCPQLKRCIVGTPPADTGERKLRTKEGEGKG